MFTGIITAFGTLERRTTHGTDQTLTIHCPDFNLSYTQLGDSIAVNGVCLTVTALANQGFSADVSQETLSLTTLGALPIGGGVNLELALTPTTALGGHLVSGHVDGVGRILARESAARSEVFRIYAPVELLRYIAVKGSITVDGVSLTVNAVDAESFSVNIIPHTLSKTTINTYQVGTQVNLEVDLIARYLERLMQGQWQGQSESLSSTHAPFTLERLRELGY